MEEKNDWGCFLILITICIILIMGAYKEIFGS